MREYSADDVLTLAKRYNNTKRLDLLVDPLQGKHLPVEPESALEMFHTLGRGLAEKYPDALKIPRSPYEVLYEGSYGAVAKSDMLSLVDSLVAPLSIVNALIAAVAAKREKELSRTFANLEKIWDEYEVYEKLKVDN